MYVKEWHPLATWGQFLAGTPVCSNWSLSKLSPGGRELALQMSHHSTIFIPHLSDGHDSLRKLFPGFSQGKLFLGPDMAELTAANVHPESGLKPVAPEFKNAFFFFPFHILPGLAKVPKEEEVNNFSSSYQRVAKPSYTFSSLSLKSDFWLFHSLVILNNCLKLKMKTSKSFSPIRELLKSRR